jgi:formate/nitrite transporter FocA (FNT family)
MARDDRAETTAAKGEEAPGETVQLTATEEHQVRNRTGLRAAVVFETVRREGENELGRPLLSLAFSGLAAGLSMGFSLAVTGVIRAALPDVPWRVLEENFGYTIGFVIVVLGRQQLFTENTVTAILPLLDNQNKRETFAKVVRLWCVVLAANLLGAAIFAFAIAHASIFPDEARGAFAQLAHDAAAPHFWVIAVRGIFAGWLIALMVWLLPAADTQKLWVVLIVTYVVGAAGLSHVIAGSVEVLYGVAIGEISWGGYFGGFLLPVFIGNVVGGVFFVSLLNYGQVAPENDGEDPN